MTAPTTTAPLDGSALDTRRQMLQQDLREREALIAELAPRAAPHIDPVAWSTTATAKVVATQIASALTRLDAGTYGQCTRCGGTIPTARLDAVPYAATCVAC